MPGLAPVPNPLVYIEWTGPHGQERVVRYDGDEKARHEMRSPFGGEWVATRQGLGSIADKMVELIVNGWAGARDGVISART